MDNVWEGMYLFEERPSGNREDVESFGSCCNPMNLRVLDDRVYTAESVSPEGRIKSYSLDGAFQALHGTAKGPASCARVTLDISADGRTLYMLDGKTMVVRILSRNE